MTDSMVLLLRGFSGQKNTFSVPRVFVEIAPNFGAALFLSQVLYWSDKGKRGDGFFYKTYADWRNEIGLSKYKVSRCINWMKDKGLLETKVMKTGNGNPAVHYRVDVSAVCRFVESHIVFKQGGGNLSLMEKQKFERGERGNIADADGCLAGSL